MSPIDERLELGTVLRDVIPSAAEGYVPAFSPFVRSGDLVHLSGRLGQEDGKPLCGKVGEEISLERGRVAARGEYSVKREECEMQEYQGGCHCGALGIIYRTDIDPMEWRLRHDGCSFCRRHGVVGTSDPVGNVFVVIRDPSKVRHYRFAHRTADFLICGECGVFVAAITDTAQGRRAVINARVLDGVSLNWTLVADVHFDDESPPQRAERRSLHWTPVVT